MRWLIAVLLLPVQAIAQDWDAAREQLKAIQAKAPGKFGFAAIDLETGKTIGIDEQLRFPMGSVYKVLIGLAALDLADQGKLQLSERIELKKEDLGVGHSPLRDAFKTGQSFTVEELLRHMVSNSDNTACDLLLSRIGGPAVVTRRLRAWGFRNVRVDRTEREISADLKGEDKANLEHYWTDPKDSSTPLEMARIMARVSRCDLIKPASCALLSRWMYETPTSSKRIKGLIPGSARVEHKTGGMPGVINDTGIIILPDGGGRIAIAAFLKAVSNADEAENAIAQATLSAFKLFRRIP